MAYVIVVTLHCLCIIKVGFPPTAGLLLGVLLTRCNVHCHKQQKRGQTERPPVYEDIQPETTAGIELQINETDGQLSR